MGKGIELATGYVTLAVETSGLAKQVSGIFRGSEGQANTSGKSMGRAMAKAFDGAKPDMDALASAVELAEKRVTAQVEQAADKQEAAKRKVEIAQAKLNEATEKYGPKSSQALTAVDRLATSEQKLEAETLQAADAQSKLQAELKQSKDALSTASKASDTASKTYAKGWKGVGQRIKGHLKGGLKSATDAAEGQAERGGREAGGGFSSAFKGAIGGLAAGFSIAAVVGGIKDVADAAGEAEQSIGAIDAVFKGNSDVMQEWAKGAKTAVGLSANEYRNLGTVLGAQLKNAGTPMDDLAGKTNGLITLGADLSSMFGGTAPEAVEAISSALKGEMDPIERYGISLSQASLEATAFNKGILKATVDKDKVAAAAMKMEIAQNKYNDAVKNSGADSDEAKKAKLGLTSAEEAFKKATAGKLPKLEGESKALAIQAALFAQSADAQGNFMREEDTYEHKRQVAIKSWADMKEKIGNAFLPALTGAMSFITTVGMPAIDGLATGLQNAATWVQQNSVWLAPLGIIVGTVAVAWGLWTGGMWLWTTATTAGTNAFKGLNAAMKANPIIFIIGLVAGLVGAMVWLYQNNETARTIIDGAWNGIKTVISWVWNNAIKPVFDAISWVITNVLAPAFVWFKDSVITPVWNFIKTAISNHWNNIKIVFTAIGDFLKKTLGPAFTWLYDFVIKPVWDGIKWYIATGWAGMKIVFKAIGDFLKNTLGPVFTWLYEKIIKPVWDMIAGNIKTVWEKIIKPVFDVLMNVVKGDLPGAFEAGKKAVKSIWDGIKKIAATPVEFIVNTVYNNGLRAMFNGISDKLKLGWELPPIEMPAYAKGGLAQKGWALVGEEGPELVNFSNPGRVYTASQTQGMLAGKEQAPTDSLGALSGSNPRQAKLANGGFWGDVWGGVKNGASSVKDWVVGQIGGVVRGLVAPLKNGLSVSLPGAGMNELIRGAGHKLIDDMTGWAVRKDEAAAAVDPAAGGGFAGSYDGPLGRFHRPSAGPYTSMFGPRWGKLHAGVDIAGGGPTFAALNGVVKYIGPGGGLPGRTGHGIRLDHGGGFQTYYGHNPYNGVKVKVGQQVTAGQRIGTQGATGNVTGTHLHFETLRNGHAENPMRYLHDQGGWLNPGTSVIENRTRKPEAILNPRQWDAAYTAIDQVASNGSGSGDVNFYGPVGAQAREVIEVIRTEKRRSHMLAGMGVLS